MYTMTVIMSYRTLSLLLLPLCLWAGVAIAQESKQVNYTLFEETPSNSYMGDIRQNAGLNKEFTPDVLAVLRYAILTQSSEYAEYFSIDPLDGTLRTAKPIDREEICPQKPSCVINFDIAVQPREHFQIIKVLVRVEDVNDNPPSFIENHITRSVPENTPPGARFALPTADDPDSPKYGVKRYEMISGAPQFTLNVSKSPTDGSTELQLVLAEPLDREKRELFTVVIACYDGGLPRKSGLLTVDVIVLDVNDNYPKFDNDTYLVTVPENVSKNSVIIKLRARDSDALANGQVVYSFTSKTQVAFGDIFGINNISGEIYVKDKLDYETNTIFNLAVIAHDKTPEALTGRAKVVIRVQDVNDHAPEITINALTTTGHVEISENAPADSFVAHIAVADPDSGVNGEMSCSMNSQFFDIQPLGNTEYKVVTTKSLDRETAGFHQVIFICKDQGLPSLTSTASIPVTVLDENDHRPIFTKSIYSAIVAENNPPGSFILQVHADDGDSGQNSMLDYKLDTDAGSYLAVDPTTGNITARVQFDYETKRELEFRVIATDHGVPPQSSTTVVRLTIRDMNDNSPEFLKDQYVFDVYENLPLGTEVGQVSATDADMPPFDSFMYFMDPGASATETFVVEPQTGKVFTRQTLDREAQSQYQLVVMAVSQESPSMQSSVKVTIHVADKNDNEPILLFPNPHNDTIHVKSKTQLGTTIARVIAEDFDIGINSKLSYKFMDGNSDGLFIMDEQSGRIAVREPLTELEDKLFILKLQVLDNGDPQNKVEAYLNIVVNKSVDHVPIINNSNLKIVISVAVISGVLVLALVIAIILTKRCERGPKMKYVNQKILKPRVLMMEAGKQTNKAKASTEPEDNNINNKREVTFSNDIDLEDERPPPNYTSSPVDKNDAGVGNNKAPAHYDQRGSTYVSLYNTRPLLSLNEAPPSARQAQQGQAQGQPQGQYQGHQGQPSHPELASTSFDRELKALVGPGGAEAAPRDRDSDSTGSDASNADSGRGSNEDTDSRPSMNDSVTHHGSDGVILMPPLQPHSQGQSDSFKVRLSSVVKMQHNHVTDHQHHLAANTAKPKVPQRPPGPEMGVPSRKPLPPQVPPKDLPKKPLPPQRAPTSGVYQLGGQSHPQNCKNVTSHPRHGDNGYQGNHGRSYHGHRTSDDETESEYSDEDKEYVYYVNASHV